jgi:aldehyde:ferredoxin oxidoreductase
MKITILKYGILFVFILIIIMCSFHSYHTTQEPMVDLIKLNEKFKMQIEKMKENVETIKNVNNIFKQ